MRDRRAECRAAAGRPAPDRAHRHQWSSNSSLTAPASTSAGRPMARA
ncbi:hypothetical protein [Streptomyces sp. NPDC007856]